MDFETGYLVLRVKNSGFASSCPLPHVSNHCLTHPPHDQLLHAKSPSPFSHSSFLLLNPHTLHHILHRPPAFYLPPHYRKSPHQHPIPSRRRTLSRSASRSFAYRGRSVALPALSGRSVWFELLPILLGTPIILAELLRGVLESAL